MHCPSCGSDNREGAKFCVKCGQGLALACPACGSPYQAGDLFCAECGNALQAPTEPAPAPLHEAPTSERRLVSVLFADLVGFTTLSELRDAEEVRELLTRYFDTCRRLVELYGGTVEKFIGDAVMAVWGTPVAQEDDAERAVRTALDLVQAIPELDPTLEARVGVLTGEAAVSLRAEGQGMVAGDLVNTASRIQSVAEPGTVLVGETTKRATEAAIAYEDADEHALKGKAEPVPLFRALRVTAGRAGALKSEGLEPPFVGRDRELRLVKELFHASEQEGKAHLVSVVGIAGIGKSRLAWEFFKYIDGLVGLVRWHRGRCLAYGEGVAYWALAEMVRMRAEIVEGEEPASARAKLEASLELHVADAEERSWIEPRLAHLLGLEERQASEREELFAAWRLFFERMAETNPVVMVFEDLQWADVSLLDFLAYLLEWSRQHPIYVLCLARPELLERHPDFAKASRNATTLSLEPLSAEAMEALLDGFVPGLPDALRTQILARAEGVPLYAVETVRMLLDRGLLVREGERYRPTGEIGALDVPETLHALVAARLDGLGADERRLLQHGSVLGKTFTKTSLAALSGQPEEALDGLLSSLVRKEVLGLQADPRSPERGQYGFLQDLVKRVAYETLSKRERKALHLSAAAYLETSWGPTEHEIVEVVASHYLAAYEAAPDAEDAGEIKAKAREHLARAGERAASLAAAEEAQRYFEQAAELTEEHLLQAQLLERAGEMAWSAGQPEIAQRYFERAIALFEQEGATHPAARVSARLGEVDWVGGRLEQAIGRMERAFIVLSGDEPDEDLAGLAAQLGRFYFFKGELELAAQRVETALTIAEALRFPEVLSQALNTMSVIAIWREHYEHAFALVKHSLEIALSNDLSSSALRAYANLGENLNRHDRYEEAIECYATGLALARRVGHRRHEMELVAEMSYSLALTGRWHELLELVGEIPSGTFAELALITVLTSFPEVRLARGEMPELEQLLSGFERLEGSVDVQERTSWAAAKARLLREEGRYPEALASAREAISAVSTLGAASQPVKHGYLEALEAAAALGEDETVDKLVAEIEGMKPGGQPLFLRAQAARFRAHLAASRKEHDSVEQGFKTAEQIFREYGIPFWLAITELEHAEWLIERGRAEEAEPLLAESREVFDRLEATPWLERAAQASPAEAVARV